MHLFFLFLFLLYLLFHLLFLLCTFFSSSSPSYTPSFPSPRPLIPSFSPPFPHSLQFPIIIIYLAVRCYPEGIVAKAAILNKATNLPPLLKINIIPRFLASIIILVSLLCLAVDESLSHLEPLYHVSNYGPAAHQ